MCGYVYCELYDIEHETAGLLTADRLPKDLGGADPATINSDTVIIIDLIAEAPGRDVGWDSAAMPTELDVPVRISHHGHDCLTANLSWKWAGTEIGDRHSAAITAEPFICSDVVTLRIPIPKPIQELGGRLNITLDNGDRATAATFLDIGPRQRTGHDLMGGVGPDRDRGEAQSPSGQPDGARRATEHLIDSSISGSPPT